MFLSLSPYRSNKTAYHGIKLNYLEFSKAAVLILFFKGKKKMTVKQACLYP